MKLLLDSMALVWWYSKPARLSPSGTFLYSLDDAFTLAKRLNARNFGAELARRASSSIPTT